MASSPLKGDLQACLEDDTLQMLPSDKSIGHRGACMQFPEHTAESYRAALVQGAGIVECDVAVTKDGELVCRHAQCDLHTSTNIVDTALASKCSTPFTPYSDTTGEGATVECCTSDLTLAEFKSLCGKMDGANSKATTAAEYLKGTASWRTDLYSTCGTLVSHAESIDLIKRYGGKFTPELKTFTRGSLSVTYDQVRAKLIQEYIGAGVPAAHVWPQSFNMPDIEYWIANYGSTFGPQAVYLDGNYCDGTLAACEADDNFATYFTKGIKYIAPPMQMLLRASSGKYAASEYAKAAKDAGLKIITWTLERSGPLKSGGGWYFGTTSTITNNDGDVYEMLHVLFDDVGIEAIFSDWPATVTFYANCKIHPAHSAIESGMQSHLLGRVDLGPRPEYLVSDMASSPLKGDLQACLEDDTLQMLPSDKSIGHRGACMQFPEHTAESYRAALVQGAGIVECDVAVTKDGELVCRHAQCDLHTSTNIVDTALASKCSTPFTPYSDTTGEGATVECCTSDLTLAEFKSLCGKMDGANSKATTAAEYLKGTASWRTDLYSTCGTLVSHAESIDLIKRYGGKFTPELKTFTRGSLSVTYDQVRAKLIQEYIGAGVPAAHVWPQSFNMPDIEYWIANYGSTFGPQAVYLDGNYCDGTLAACEADDNFATYFTKGIKYIAPPMQMLLRASSGKYAASEYAKAAKDAGLKIITWTLERSGPLKSGGGWYFGTTSTITNNDGDVYEMLHVLFDDVGIEAIFSDWPATVTFYANCKVHPSRRPPPDPTPAPTPEPTPEPEVSLSEGLLWARPLAHLLSFLIVSFQICSYA